MRGFIDLHCHWVAGIDDGVKTAPDGILLLRKLREAGFDTVIATPHMRPGMFDNDKTKLESAFARMLPALSGEAGLPEVHLSSEHFLDDVVFGRLTRGEGCPYPVLGRGPDAAPGGRAALVEFPAQMFPARVAARFFDLQKKKITPVLAHPERYAPVWKDDRCLDELLDTGAHLLLDVCSLVGKYGRAAQRAAEKLLEDEAYEAACSDAHRPSDVDAVVESIERLTQLVGKEETTRLLADGPRAILSGRAP
jgi:protein-tyrosine phosphatase